MIVFGIFITGLRSSAQQSNDNDLYQLTCEMADIIINYDADEVSVLFHRRSAATRIWSTARRE